MLVVWVVAAAVLLGIEIFATAFYAVFIAAGLIGGVSVLGVVVARPPLVRLMERRRPEVSLPGVQNIVGQRAMTVDEVGDEHHPGHAVLAGERWLAISEDGTPLPPDLAVTIAEVRGTTLVVRPAKPSTVW